MSGSSISSVAAAVTRPLGREYQRVREFTNELCGSLETEDYMIQSMPDASPAKWHLAHVSWFFETFILGPANVGYLSPNPRYSYLFNSYYNAVGPRHCRPKRGMISRPTVEETFGYRQYVDQAMLAFIERADERTLEQWRPMIELGLNHEQQHQELLLTDVKHAFAQNPLNPVFFRREMPPSVATPDLEWVSIAEGVFSIGHEGDDFCYDNETPRHRVFLEPFQIASRLITSGDYLEFMGDGGYARPEFWLSEGWATAQAEGWTAPLYWQLEDERWMQMTLCGLQPVDPNEPVCHVSFFEANAFANWANARLPNESEWEVAAADLPREGNFVEQMTFHPVPLQPVRGMKPLQQMFGDVWEWTQSDYAPYPGFRAAPGAVGEYNGKFMCNQYVLRGGSCATSLTHIRPTYRNFFPPSARWQFTGIRLARSAR